MAVNELPPLEHVPDEAHERDLSIWAAGWDACMAWLWPLYQRAESEADRFYRAAYCPTPAPKWGPSYAERQQMIRDLQEQRAREGVRA